MIKNIIIIYLEGDGYTKSKQEEKFFTHEISRRIWDYSFTKIGYSKNYFFVWPKIFPNENIKKRKFFKLEKEIAKFSKESKNLLIITGDHDEINDCKALKKRKLLAQEIETELNFNNDILEKKIILKKDKKFKIETLMTELTGIENINKKILRQKINTECPTILELFDILDKNMKEKEVKELFFKNFIKSKHELLSEIKTWISEII